MKTAIEDVAAFHRATGTPIRDEPGLPEDERILLRLDLIDEEVGEIRRAVLFADLIEVADGIADTIYVLIGAALEFGIPLDRVWDEVHRSNMDKVRGGLRMRPDGKILKPDDWDPPDIAGALGLPAPTAAPGGRGED